MLDYTVVVNVRHQFGSRNLNAGVFAGRQIDFRFDCPGINSRETALLLFQSSSVRAEQTLTINGSIVFGQIPPSPRTFTANENPALISLGGWSGNVMFVSPNTLSTSGNVMHVESVDDAHFWVDNVVVLYKRASQGPVFEPR